MKEKYSEQGRDPYDGLRFYSALTHGIGIVFALLALGILLHMTLSMGAAPRTVTSVSIYAVSMLCLYTASTVYHSLNTSLQGRLFLRKLDHVMIYFLIAGTYTPICTITLGGTVSGRVMLAVIWAMALLGTGFTLFWIRMPRILTSLIYLVMGWTAIFAIYPLHAVMDSLSFTMLLSGGILYSIGGILYALKWPGRDNKYFGCHEIFHVFIVLGSICHFIMIYQIVR
jgi:hemolysin III